MIKYKKGFLSVIIGSITGGIFLLSGFGKLPNVAIFQSLIIDYGFASLYVLGPLIVLAEIILGVSLCLGIYRKHAAMLSFSLVILFTIAYTYGYKYHGVIDCGCFGDILIETNPFWVYLRNFVLLSLLGYLSIQTENQMGVPRWKQIIAWTIIIPSVFIAGMTSYIRISEPSQHPFWGKSVHKTDLASKVTSDKNRILVTFMSPNCSHCLNSIENYTSYKEKGWVDTSFCYILINSELGQDSLLNRLYINYPEVSWNVLHRDSIDFIEAFPTTFFIEHDTVKAVHIGEIPSPLLLLGNKSDRTLEENIEQIS